MQKIQYKIEFFSDWHCGSGLCSGTDMDSLVLRDQDGFPYIPGKSIKGLLREAAESLYLYSQDIEWKKFLETCFGLETDKQKNNFSQQGVCYFSNAEIEENLRIRLKKDEKQRFLFRKIYSTAIENSGQAKNHSLRSMEVAVPLVLWGEIAGYPEGHKQKMIQCMEWIKRLGTNRNRGLGRCRMEEKTA